jgi:hypothetical protein
MKNSKFQNPSSKETLNIMDKMTRISNAFAVTAWSLKLGASLELGTWNLELS